MRGRKGRKETADNINTLGEEEEEEEEEGEGRPE